CQISSPPAIYSLSLHDALPICSPWNSLHKALWLSVCARVAQVSQRFTPLPVWAPKLLTAACRCAITPTVPWLSTPSLRKPVNSRSEEHTSELQSRFDLVCRLLL